MPILFRQLGYSGNRGMAEKRHYPSLTRFLFLGGSITSGAYDSARLQQVLGIEAPFGPLALCCLGRPIDERPALRARLEAALTSLLPKVELVRCPDDSSSAFAEAAQRAPLLYFAGGIELEYKKHLSKESLAQIVGGKTVLASSAGVNIFSSKFFSNDRDQIEEGLGLLTINTICHYDPAKAERASKLAQACYPQPVVCLEERQLIELFSEI